jgi:tetratricopeptide (TPR) repeat protein
MMEFEFSESGGGQFVSTGKVVQFITGHLGRGEIDQAVQLYEGAASGVGDTLVAEARSASKQVQKNLANMFYRARDFKRAAELCERIGEWAPAAKAHEAALALDRAAECWLRAGQKDRAAPLLEKAGQPRRAAELLVELGDLAGASGALEAAGALLEASRLARRAGDAGRAAQQLARVTPQDPAFGLAQLELAELLVELGRPEVAIQRLIALIPPDRRLRDPTELEAAYRLGLVFGAAGRREDAAFALELVRQHEPSYKDVSARLATLAASSTGSTAVPTTSGPHPGSAHPSGAQAAVAPLVAGVPTAPASTGATLPALAAVSPTASLAADLRGLELAPTPSATYELLKRLPIFDELSIEEMRDFHAACERRRFAPGEVVIEQGRSGPGLFIVQQGSLEIVFVEGGGHERVVTRLGAGTYVGEMSLIDDAPTSARVRAAEPVETLHIRRDVFRRYLYTHDLVALRVYKSFVRTLAERLRETNARLRGR